MNDRWQKWIAEDRMRCTTCRHFGGWTCAAFGPSLIPVPFSSGEFGHTMPVPGDHGIQWEPCADAIAAWVPPEEWTDEDRALIAESGIPVPARFLTS